MARNRPQAPISGFDKVRMSTIKLKSPKRDTEERCRMEKKAERIQYDEKIFFNGLKIFWNEVQ
jgi:hypothetical protein